MFNSKLKNRLEYLHGTGHGVGSYLNVHEDPIGISWRPCPDDPGLEPNMFLSNGNYFLSRTKGHSRISTI